MPKSGNTDSNPINVNRNYKKHVWVASFLLVLFFAIYFFLTAWFSYHAYQIISDSFQPDGNPVSGIIFGLPLILISFFLIKGIFKTRHSGNQEGIEIQEAEHPKLFKLLYDLADEIEAPRPHKVFLSPNVNACVFYDLNFFNFLFPSKKNLEIGLGLVNILNASELKAVLAHEFGHFAQKSMAVGTWLYLSSQVADQLIHQRDRFDKMILGISNLDIRIAWIGWGFAIIIWAIRAVVDSIYKLAVIAKNSLGKEMEFQADSVAVSVTGSDALIHALHKLHAAEEAWQGALNFVQTEMREHRIVEDVFFIQSRLIQIYGKIYDDKLFGKAPPLPEKNRDQHLIFKSQIATPPLMWSTHPDNAERERNAKSHYLYMEIDNSSGWEIFSDPKQLRQSFTSNLYNIPESEIDKVQLTDTKTALENLDKGFKKAFYSSKFHGVYLNRLIGATALEPDHLYDDNFSSDDLQSDLKNLYPKTLGTTVKELKALNEEFSTLTGIYNKQLKSSEKKIVFRGKEIKFKSLPVAIETVEKEINDHHALLETHDKRARSVHLAIAKKLGGGWSNLHKNHVALLRLLNGHLLNIKDLQSYLGNTIAVAFADNKVSSRELKRIIKDAQMVTSELRGTHNSLLNVSLGHFVSKDLAVTDFTGDLSEFNLADPTKQNISEWLSASQFWLNYFINLLQVVSDSTLDQLLKIESYVATQFINNKVPPKAPLAPVVPLTKGGTEHLKARKRYKLSLWDRIYLASGFIPGVTRFTFASIIVAMVVTFAGFTGTSSMTIYNGLSNTVQVQVNAERFEVGAYQSLEVTLPREDQILLKTTTSNHLIEEFQLGKISGFSEYIYNVASASPLIEWTQVYGDARNIPDKSLGNLRWQSTKANHLFTEPPESVQTKKGFATRTVVDGLSHLDPETILHHTAEDQRQYISETRAQWDSTNSVYIEDWIYQAAQYSSLEEVLTKRTAAFPDDIVSGRLIMDSATSVEQFKSICRNYIEQSEQDPNSIGYKYLAIRCQFNSTEAGPKFELLSQSNRHNPWLAYEASKYYLREGKWDEAEVSMRRSLANGVGYSYDLAADYIRLLRMVGQNTTGAIQRYQTHSQQLRNYLQLESGKGLEVSPYRVYSILNQGRIDDAYVVADDMEESKDRTLRLIGASDGSDQLIKEQVDAIDLNRGLDDATILLTWYRIKKLGYQSKDFEELIRNHYHHGNQIVSILNQVHTKGNYSTFEADLVGLDLVERGYVYAAASVILGDQSPMSWKSRANKILFASERPFLNIPQEITSN